MLTMLGWDQSQRESTVPLPLQRCYNSVRVVDWPSPTNVRRLDLGALPMIAEFHRNGILLDQSRFKSLESKLSEQVAQAEADCWREAGRRFNPGSSDQVGELLFREMGLKPKLGIKRTATGKVSTDADTLKQMRAEYPIVAYILKYRELDKIKGTYVDTMPKMVGPDGRLRTTFRHTNTGTGRLSSEDPNLQNIPVRTGLGKEIRNGFVARTGCKLGSIDLSQIEMVVAGDLSLDRFLCQAFVEGVDIHTETALLAFRLPREAVNWPEFKQKYRLPAKCFHPDTEVLTKSGWKRILDLKPGEEVVQAIPGRDCQVNLEWAKPLEVFEQYHPAGELIHMKNVGMDLRVTPDHRMLGWTVQGNPKVYMAEKFTEAECCRYWANAGEIEGGRGQDIGLLRLAVALQADGSITKWGSIRWGFSKVRKSDRLRRLLKDCAIPFMESVYKNGSNGMATQFSVKKGDAGRVIELLDSDKTLPWWWLDLTAECRRAIVDEAQFWDSHVTEKRYIYTSANRKNVDVLQAVCSITNRKTRIQPETGTVQDGWQRMNCMTVRHSNKSRMGNLSVKSLDYREKVACISVPSTFLLVRDGGIPVICGQTVGFGILYGQTPAGAQENIIAQGGPYIPIEEVEEIIRNWFLVYEGVARWMQQQYARVRRYGMAWDAFGRSRVIPEGRSVIPRVQSAGLRQAGNMPVQATAGGILKLAMAELQDALLDWRRAYPSEILLPLLQIHDELVFELSESLADDWCEYAKGVMTQAVRLTIPVGASASVGDCWGELK